MKSIIAFSLFVSSLLFCNLSFAGSAQFSTAPDGSLSVVFATARRRYEIYCTAGVQAGFGRWPAIDQRPGAELIAVEFLGGGLKLRYRYRPVNGPADGDTALMVPISAGCSVSDEPNYPAR